ncbi:MAG: hypothetical protein ABIB71_05545, partial [Candidatus Woesearchaeota archaeon]
VTVVFSDKGMAKLLDEIKTKVIAHVPDTKTEQGRKDIISLAYKITRSKTLIDDLGKGVVSDWKKKAKLIDEHRKTARDFLDDLKNTARQPLTDWEAEQAIIKEKEVAAAKEKIQARLGALFAVNVILPFQDVALMSDADYEDKLILATDAFRTEQLRVAEEQAIKEAEEKKLAEERAEIEKIKIEQEARARAQTEREASLKAQEAAIETAKRKEIERQEQIAWQERETERLRILAEVDAAEKIAREAREKKEKEIADLAEKARAEALRPDREKLEQYAIGITAIIGPNVKSKEAHKIVMAAEARLAEIADTIIKQAEAM